MGCLFIQRPRFNIVSPDWLIAEAGLQTILYFSKHQTTKCLGISLLFYLEVRAE